MGREERKKARQDKKKARGERKASRKDRKGERKTERKAEVPLGKLCVVEDDGLEKAKGKLATADVDIEQMRKLHEVAIALNEMLLAEDVEAWSALDEVHASLFDPEGDEKQADVDDKPSLAKPPPADSAPEASSPQAPPSAPSPAPAPPTSVPSATHTPSAATPAAPSPWAGPSASRGPASPPAVAPLPAPPPMGGEPSPVAPPPVTSAGTPEPAPQAASAAAPPAPVVAAPPPAADSAPSPAAPPHVVPGPAAPMRPGPTSAGTDIDATGMGSAHPMASALPFDPSAPATPPRSAVVDLSSGDVGMTVAGGMKLDLDDVLPFGDDDKPPAPPVDLTVDQYASFCAERDHAGPANVTGVLERYRIPDAAALDAHWTEQLRDAEKMQRFQQVRAQYRQWLDSQPS